MRSNRTRGATSNALTQDAKESHEEYIQTLQQQVYLLEVERDLLKKARDAQQREALQQKARPVSGDQSVDDILAALKEKFTLQETGYQTKLTDLQSKVEELEIEIEARERVDEEIATNLTSNAKGFATRGISISDIDKSDSCLSKARRELVESKMNAEAEMQALREETSAKLQLLRDQISKQIKEIASLQDRISTLNDQRDALTEDLNQLKEASQQNRQDLSQVNGEILALRKELTATTIQNKDLEQKREALLDTYSRLEEQYAQLVKDKNAAESQVRTLLLDSQSAAQQNEVLMTKELLKEREAQIEALARELNESKNGIYQRDRKIEKLLSEMSGLRQSASSAEETAQVVRLSLEEAQGEVAVLRKQLDRSAHSDDKYRLEMEYKTIAYERDQLLDKVAHRDAEILRLKKENAIMDGKLNRSLADTLPTGYSLGVSSVHP